jgi:meso-butanediol dehydrogenase/(S,S)-butanediol dehydrogenase/diacetyl reductase
VIKQRFAGKVAHITGGGSGIGEAAARRLLDEGASVVISGRKIERLDKTLATMLKDRAMAQQADVSIRADCDALVALN